MRRLLLGLALIPFLTLGQQSTELASKTDLASKVDANGSKAMDNALRSFTPLLPNDSGSIAMDNALRSLSGQIPSKGAQSLFPTPLSGTLTSSLESQCAIPLLKVPGNPAVDKNISHKIEDKVAQADPGSKAKSMQVCHN